MHRGGVPDVRGAVRAEGTQEVHNLVLHVSELLIMALHSNTFGLVEQGFAEVQHEWVRYGAS